MILAKLSGVQAQGTHNLRLPFRLLLGHSLPNLLSHQVVPLQLAARSLVHSGLERVQLRYSLELLNRLNRFFQEVDVGITVRSLFADGLEHGRVLLQMLRRPVQEVLEVQTMRVRVSRALLPYKMFKSANRSL